MSNKISKAIGFLRKLHNLTKASTYNISAYVNITRFIRPYLEYGDIIYDQASNSSFYEKLESIWCNAALDLTGAIKESSKEKLYQDLSLESLQLRRWYRRLYCFNRIYNKQTHDYLSELTSIRNKMYQTIDVVYIPFLGFKYFFWKYIFPKN